MTSFKTITKTPISISSDYFITIMSLYFGFVLNIPVVTKLVQLASEHGNPTFAYFSPLLLSATFVLIFSIFNIPYFRKPFFVFLTITSAMASYATYKYGVMFDYSMIENVFETNSGELFSYVNWISCLYVLILGIIPSVLIARTSFKSNKSLKRNIINKLTIIISALFIITIIFIMSYKNYASVGRNNAYLNRMITPSHIYYSAKYIKNTFFTTPLEYKIIGEDAKIIPAQNGKASLIVLVVGETARSSNISYNGYSRNTNPYTENLGIISFKDTSSCGTATAHSLPCMFSNLNRSNYRKERANAQDNALDIIKRSGTSVVWVENDGGDKSVAKHLDKREITPNDYPDYCSEGVCTDEVMLEEFDRNMRKKQMKNKLMAFHIIGSHGPTYWKRYPKNQELFTPACNQSDIENCSDEEIINVYDNTIAHTDYIIAKLIGKLEKYRDQYNVALMYISDHGESLGENGLYLHGTPYSLAPNEQTHVPWFLWMDSAFEKAYKINRQCLKSKGENEHVSQDNLFHSLIDFASVGTSSINKDMSIFSSCRTSDG
ncbi:phosphoethanolamine transferase [Vibrio sp. F74]|uniref:phosphoethanolamine transferase n=1 Tax=Vibrio sp. F74 TaxID=700020 RepID=UPI0035F533A9